MKVSFTLVYSFDKAKEDECFGCKHFKDHEGECSFNYWDNSYGECDCITKFVDNGYKGSNINEIEVR